MKMLGERLFTDDTRSLDRFGLLLLLTVASVTVASLVNVDETSTGLGAFWRIMVSVTIGLTLIVAVGAAGVARRPRMIIDAVAVAGAALAVLTVLGEQFFSSPTTGDFAFARGVVWFLITAMTPIFVARRIAVHDRVTRQTLFGALAAFLLIAIAFNYGMLVVDAFGPNPYFGQPEPSTSFMYFSLVTITTLGYGDLSAKGELGRYLATSEAVIGQIFLVTFVARLVSLYGRPSPENPRASDAD
jgi:hypothetical protein